MRMSRALSVAPTCLRRIDMTQGDRFFIMAWGFMGMGASARSYPAIGAYAVASLLALLMSFYLDRKR